MLSNFSPFIASSSRRSAVFSLCPIVTHFVCFSPPFFSFVLPYVISFYRLLIDPMFMHLCLTFLPLVINQPFFPSIYFISSYIPYIMTCLHFSYSATTKKKTKKKQKKKKWNAKVFQLPLFSPDICKFWRSVGFLEYFPFICPFNLFSSLSTVHNLLV